MSRQADGLDGDALASAFGKHAPADRAACRPTTTCQGRRGSEVWPRGPTAFRRHAAARGRATPAGGLSGLTARRAGRDAGWLQVRQCRHRSPPVLCPNSLRQLQVHSWQRALRVLHCGVGAGIQSVILLDPRSSDAQPLRADSRALVPLASDRGRWPVRRDDSRIPRNQAFAVRAVRRGRRP